MKSLPYNNTGYQVEYKNTRMSVPEKDILSDQPAHQEGEERHEEELGDKSNPWPDGLPKHLHNDGHVELSAHVDGVDEDHDDHDAGAEAVEEGVAHDDVEGLGVHVVLLYRQAQVVNTNHISLEDIMT